MKPSFDLDKIKFSIDEQTWNKAVGLFEKGKISQFEELLDGYSATVLGTSPYHVFVSAKHHDRGSCDCYLGQKEILCKHMTAVAVWAVTGDQKLSEGEREINHQIKFSGKVDEPSDSETEQVKTEISTALKYIKAYTGPSKIWFQYQDYLSEGCNRLAKIFSGLPASEHPAELIVETLLKLDKKLTSGGVDDSDGVVGDFIVSTVDLLLQFVDAKPECKSAFVVLSNKTTCFGWEEPLLKYIENN